MKDICIPISHISDNQIAEITVKIEGVEQKFNFRVESFPWNTSAPAEERIAVLRHVIETYDKGWEIMQIYNPSESSDYIHVLFRKRT